jgi:hypothetical protein
LATCLNAQHRFDIFRPAVKVAIMTPLVSDGVLIGIVEGLFLGLIPIITGMKKSQPGLAIGGFFACIVVGAIGGLILGVPAAALFWWFIKKAENKSKDFK